MRRDDRVELKVTAYRMPCWLTAADGASSGDLPRRSTRRFLAASEIGRSCAVSSLSSVHARISFKAPQEPLSVSLPSVADGALQTARVRVAVARPPIESAQSLHGPQSPPWRALDGRFSSQQHQPSPFRQRPAYAPHLASVDVFASSRIRPAPFTHTTGQLSRHTVALCVCQQLKPSWQPHTEDCGAMAT